MKAVAMAGGLLVMVAAVVALAQETQLQTHWGCLR